MSNALATTQSTALSAMPESELIGVLQTSLYPGAAIGSVKMVLGYCKAAGLDPMQKPVHIVPMWDKNTKAMRDVIMPGIGLYRTNAARTGQYAGVTEPDFGPDITENIGGTQITFPAWCRVTVKRLLGNQVVEFAAKEFWKENYATAGKDSAAPNAMWKKRPYGQIAKCFDEETEVLTTLGFQKFGSVTGKILQVEDGTLSTCNSVPFVQDYNGEMVVADGTRLNFSVTPNHDMLTTAGKIEAGKLFDQATQVGSKFAIPRAPHSKKPDANVSDSVLRLLGYFLADGSHTGYRQFRIAVSRDYKIEALREISLHQSEGVKRDAGRVAIANGREIVTGRDKAIFSYDFGLIEQFANAEKAIDIGAILGLSQRQARVVIDALLEFDGSDNGNGVRRLSQRNKEVLRSFEVAAIHAGYSISAPSHVQSDIGEADVITVSDAAHFPVVRGAERNSASLVKRMNVSGKVWCVTVPSGVIVVRRHGFSMLCGNCAEAQALRKAFPELGSAPTADEMEGREFEQEAQAAPRQDRVLEQETYPQSSFDTNLPKWKKLIQDGTKTAEQIIKTVQSKNTLTEDQIKTIKAIKQQVIEGEVMTEEEVAAIREREMYEGAEA